MIFYAQIYNDDVGKTMNPFSYYKYLVNQLWNINNTHINIICDEIKRIRITIIHSSVWLSRKGNELI